MESAPLLGVLLLSLPAASQGQVHVVDAAGGSGSDFTSIGAAIAAAADGDVVLVRAGTYGTVFLSSRSAVITAEVGAQVDCDALRVLDLAPDEHVLVQGLRFSRVSGEIGQLERCEGPLWLERCCFEFFPFDAFMSHPVSPEDCDSLVIVRSQILSHGPSGSISGIFATRSRLHVYESEVESRDSVPVLPGGLSMREGFAEVIGSIVKGPPGPAGNAAHCDGFDGGAAVRLLSGGASRLVTQDSRLVGGPGGPPDEDSCQPGAPGPEVAILSSGSVWEKRSGIARSHEVGSPLREGEPLVGTFRGAPGDRVWLLLSSRPRVGRALPAVDGELLLEPPFDTTFVGTVPASGVLQITTRTPDLPAGVEGRVFYGQAVFREAAISGDVDQGASFSVASGRFVASSPTAVVVLDQAF